RLRNSLVDNRKLDRGNPNPGNIGADFGRFVCRARPRKKPPHPGAALNRGVLSGDDGSMFHPSGSSASTDISGAPLPPPHRAGAPPGTCSPAHKGNDDHGYHRGSADDRGPALGPRQANSLPLQLRLPAPVHVSPAVQLPPVVAWGLPAL